MILIKVVDLPPTVQTLEDGAQLLTNSATRSLYWVSTEMLQELMMMFPPKGAFAFLTLLFNLILDHKNVVEVPLNVREVAKIMEINTNTIQRGILWLLKHRLIFRRPLPKSHGGYVYSIRPLSDWCSNRELLSCGPDPASLLNPPQVLSAEYESDEY